jgi:hypothetical protein
MMIFLLLLLLLLGACCAASSYDEVFAKWMVGYSACVYCEDCVREDKLACTGCQLNSGSVLVESFFYPTDATFAALFVNFAQQAIVLAFRGTAPVEIRNYFTDLDIAKDPADYVNGTTHSGFTEAFRGMRDTTPMLASVVALALRFPELRVVVTGHSLGAALATLTTVSLLADPKAVAAGLGPRLSLFGFGSPLVGDPTWADAATALFDSKGVTYFRIVHFRDPVCAIPLTSLGFKHIANEVFYDNDMKEFEVCRQATNGTCSDQLTIRVSFDDHLFYFDVFVGLTCGSVSNAPINTLPGGAPTTAPQQATTTGAGGSLAPATTAPLPRSPCDRGAVQQALSACTGGAFGAAGACISESECAQLGGEFHATIGASQSMTLCPFTNVGCCVRCTGVPATQAPTAAPRSLFTPGPGEDVIRGGGGERAGAALATAIWLGATLVAL